VAIDAQGLTKSGVAAWLSGARRRIGFRGLDGRELSPVLTNEGVRPTACHVVDRNLELLGPLGVVRPPVRFDVPVSAAEVRSAVELVRCAGLNGAFAVVNPGAGWPSKLWPPHRYAAVADHLMSAHRLPALVVWAGDAERQMAETIVSRADGGAVMAPPTNLRELASLLSSARLFVGSDTGPLHLAAAVGTPSVGLIGPMPSDRNGPYGPQHRAVQVMPPERMARRNKRTCRQAMLVIEVDHVVRACDELLAQHSVCGRTLQCVVDGRD
jgi:ADP-heptose:LPS heptosyltransferase